METVTARDVITRAFVTLGQFGLEDSIDAAPLMLGLHRLNSMIGGWALEPLLAPTSTRTVIPIVLGKGTLANPITIGPTGDVVSATVPFELEGAALLMSGPAPQVEIFRTVYTAGQYDSLPVKALTSALSTGVYYTNTTPNGEIVLWPVPDTTIHALVIYRTEPIPAFANLSTQYMLPDGYSDALDFNLAIRLAPGSGIQVTPDLRDLAVKSLATIKRAHLELSDLENDFSGGGWYDIVSDSIR